MHIPSSEVTKLSPWCHPVSQQKVTITKPLQFWPINLLLGCSAFYDVLGQTAVKMCLEVSN
jgi:hypothetical protein